MDRLTHLSAGNAGSGDGAMMRVCMLNDNYFRSSGAATAIRRIVAAMQGVEYRFAGCDSEGLLEDLSWIPAGHYRRFDLKTSNPFRVFLELRRFRRWLEQERMELVHCHHRRLACLLRLARVPVMYTGHLAFPPAGWFRRFHPKYMTAVTPSVGENIFETTGTAPIACIGNPVEFPDSPGAVDVDRVRSRAVCIARLAPVKGQAHLLAAWKLLHARGHSYHLDLVGEGPSRPDLEAAVERDGLRSLVHFVGFSSNVDTILRQSLFAVLVSEVEGQGLVTLEAAAQGRPSLLTAVPGSIDLLPPARTLPNGLKFGDVEGLADALEAWFNDPEAVVREGRIFFEFLKTSSDPGTVARRYRQIYGEVLEAVRRERGQGTAGAGDR